MFKKVILAAALALCFFAAGAQEIDSQWKGARVAFLGDSITDARQLKTQDVFWHQLVPILGIEPYVYGISGHRTHDILGQAQKLLAEHQNDFDAIIIFIGTNDFNGNVAPGEWFREEVKTTNKDGLQVDLKHRVPVMDGGTVRSDINIFMSYIKHNFPTKQVILLTPIHRAFFSCDYDNIQPDELYANTLGLYIDDYIKIIKETADVWAVPVIDLAAICGLYPLEENHTQYFRQIDMGPDSKWKDWLHPNTPGHLRMAYALAYQLLGYPSKF